MSIYLPFFSTRSQTAVPRRRPSTRPASKPKSVGRIDFEFEKSSSSKRLVFSRNWERPQIFFFFPSSFHFFKFPRIIFGFRRGREKVLPNKKLRRKKLFKVCSNVQIRLFYNISPAKFWQTANCNWMNTNYELKL